MFLLTYVTVNTQNVLLWLVCRHGDVYATGEWHRHISHILTVCPVESLHSLFKIFQ